MITGKCIFSVDVEDWFHILDIPATPDISEWDSLPSFVEKNFLTLLDIFQEKEVQVTCFFLAWVAQKFPGLVKEALSRGHEIASHGFSHKLTYEMGERPFFEDVKKAKDMLEDISGSPVSGYRATGFSVTEDTPWYFEKLIEAGYKYSSSVFPATRGHGGLSTDNFAPYIEKRHNGEIIEFPISVAKQFGKPICFFGGGYLRLFPYFLIKRKAQQVLKENRPVVFYIHPREIDPGQPRLPMNFKRAFKSYVNLKGTEQKVQNILDDFDVTTFQNYISMS
jgi:polysaccharide deacetylase family protein (PEP-CTERM system associated)